MEIKGSKVFVARMIPHIGIQMLRDAGCIITQHTERRNLTPEELVNYCKDNDALLSAGPNKINAQFLSQCQHLKVISLLSVGYDHVDINAATQYKIPVSNTPGILSKATSDIAFLLMIAVSRKAFYMNSVILNGNWGFNDPTADLGIELYGKTLGVFGLGSIGFEMAKKCRAAYDMNIIYHNRNHNEEAEKELGATYVSFDELLQKSDVLTVHANLSDETKEIFNRDAFSRMKPSSVFINTGRGALHNEAHLTEALAAGYYLGCRA